MVKVDGVRTAAVEKASSPVSRMTEDANRVEYEVDARGRKIGCKKLTFLDSHKITCLLGDDASNAAALNQALVMASVADIDGDPVRLPVKLSELHALMARLDFEGVAAATVAMARFAPIRDGDVRDAVKN